MSLLKEMWMCHQWVNDGERDAGAPAGMLIETTVSPWARASWTMRKASGDLLANAAGV